MFSESLTVRILADSSQLQSELKSVGQKVSELRSQLSQASDIGGKIAGSLQKIGSAAAPLQRISRLISQITSQVQRLSGIPVNINTQPAQQSLNALIALINTAIAQLQALNAMSAGGGGGGLPVAPPSPPTPPPTGPRPGFSTGGLVTGPSGADRIPAMLTAGEFVIQQEAARSLGLDTLNDLNQHGSAAIRNSANQPPSEAPPTINHFGGISLNVSQDVELSQLLDDIAFEADSLRTRRG